MRAKRLTPAEALRIRARFLRHARLEYAAIRLDYTRVIAARKLTLRHNLRALDAIQLASAMEAQRQFNVPVYFISGDNDLLAAAVAEGFTTDNPYLHP